MTIKGLKAFTILSDATPGGIEPWPASYDTADDVAMWFRKVREAGYTLEALPDGSARILKEGKPQRKVWVEDASYMRVSLVRWL